jgi:hypothetical protein
MERQAISDQPVIVSILALVTATGEGSKCVLFQKFTGPKMIFCQEGQRRIPSIDEAQNFGSV